MTRTTLHRILLVLILPGVMAPAAIHASDSDMLLAFQYPELARYFRAFERVHAAVFEEIVQTNASAESQIGKDQLRESLRELASARTSHYHSAGNHLAMLGPYRVFESRATPGLLAMLLQDFSAAEADRAFAQGGRLPPVAVEVLARGRAFQNRLLEICLDHSIYNKKAAMDAAVADYLSDASRALPALPKSSDLLSKHPHAYAFRVGFPQLSGLTWASQWLQLAALEILVTGAEEEYVVSAAINRAIDLYVEKTARQHGSLMVLPADIPRVPVIAPNFYSAHPQAATIIDNLSVLKIIIADILAHPDVLDRGSAIEAAIVSFTDKNNQLDNEIDYLRFVLRGGIYNQGGAALGGMLQSERNRSRESLENPHISPFPMGPSP